MKNKCTSMMLRCVLALCGLCFMARAENPVALPDPETGGADGGPIAVLFLSTHWWLDATYKKELIQEGYAVTFVQAVYEPLSYQFVKRFNVIVIDLFPRIGEEQGRFGYRQKTFDNTMSYVWRCMREGAGVLVFTDLFDGGTWLRAG